MICYPNRSIAKYIKTQLPNTTHEFDLWHVAKGFSKKLQSAAAQRECFILHSWAPSIINHLYWSAASTSEGPAELKVAKWLSVVGHVQDQHHHHGDLFPDCLHGDLSAEEGRKLWIEPGR